MRIFEELEMEFFAPMDELPNKNEKVVIILKPGIHHNPFRYTTFTEFATVPPKFVEQEKYGSRFTIGQVRCWGRLIKQ